MSKIKPCDDDNSNSKKKSINPLDLHMLLGKMQGNTGDLEDYMVLSMVLNKNKIEPLVELLKIYIERYIEDGEEADNILALFLLYTIRTKYNVHEIKISDKRKCTLDGWIGYVYDSELDYYGTFDFYHSIHNK